jgi:predicted Fe-Mo cluster-binding NifX family protein
MERIAIPSDGEGYLAHFGGARVMAVFAVEHATIVARENRTNPDPEHLDPAHHRVMLDLVRGCDVVIASHIGAPMITSLTTRGVRVLGAPSDSVDLSLQAYLQSLTGGTPLEVLAAAPNGHTPDRHQDIHVT